MDSESVAIMIGERSAKIDSEQAMIVAKEFQQIEWDERTADDCRHLIRLAVREDLDRGCDLTTLALVSEKARGRAVLNSRQPGVLAGLPAVRLVLEEMNLDVEFDTALEDGRPLQAGSRLGELKGSTRDLLTAERLILNLLGRLCGIASLTHAFVERVAGTRARIYDTRKTTPGWRRLEKYAVRCGGGRNHRTGLFDAVLIKDNHLAQAAGVGITAADAVRRARQFLAAYHPDRSGEIVEIEVDTLVQLDQVLASEPDVVLLDNMSVDLLREAVRRRNAAGSAAELEASGGVHFGSVHAIAETGVDRISVGSLTHSASSLDIGLDWDDE